MSKTSQSPGWPQILVGSAGVASALLGGVVLLGWYKAPTAEVQTLVNAAPMQPNTAVGFLLCGGAAVALACGRGRTAIVFSGGVLLLAFLSSLQDLAGLDLGIDQLLVKPHTTTKTSHPGRMAPNTALSFSLCAAALTLLSTSRRTDLSSLFAGVLAAVSAALASVAIVGYTLDVESAYGWGDFTRMAMNTAVGFLLLAPALFLYSWTDHETRRLRVPRWLPLPVAVGGLTAAICVWRALTVFKNGVGRWLRSFFLLEKNFVDKYLAELALGAGLAIALLLTLAIYLAQKATLRTAERKQALRALRKAHDELERRVERRTAEIAKVNDALKKEIRSRERLERMLRQRAELLADADRRKDEFLAMLGHELRNPLATVSLGLETMAVLTPENPAFSETQEVMKQRLRHIVRLVDDLLDISRFTSGKIKLRKNTVDLRAVVSRVVENSQPLIEEYGHAVTVSLPQDSLAVEGDSVRLEQVVSNLLSNAIKYTEKNGQVWVTLEREGSEAVLRVRDQGIGIESELLPTIFDSFAQADLSLDRAESGLGLGLTLVERLVGLHDGTVEAFSEGPGKGSEFVVRLALAAHEAPRDNRAEAGDLPAPVPLRVLIVDDRVDLVKMFERLLKIWGHEVFVAYDGPGALEIASTATPDVALIDIGLPGMSGYDLAARLRQQTTKKAVLIAVTGYGQSDHRRRVKEAGFDHHLVKPVDLHALKEILHGLPEESSAVNSESASSAARKRHIDDI